MTTTAVINVFCKDRSGVFADLADALAFLGADLQDMNASVLGDGVIFAALSSWPGEVPVDRVETTIRDLRGLAEAEVHVSAYPYRDTAGDVITHFARLSTMLDKPGDLAALCAVFTQYNASLTRVNARRLQTGQGAEYRVLMEANVPAAAATSCMAGLEFTAGRLGYDFDWEVRVNDGGREE